MSQAKSQNIVSTAALLAYGAVVVVPLGFLFTDVALHRPPPPPAPPARAAAPGPVTPPHPTTGPAEQDPRLPPFDAYGADEAPAFPDLLLASVAGGPPQRLSAVRRGPTIVHLWSLACETCADEWPTQNAFVAANTGEGRPFPPVVSILVVPDAGEDEAASARQQLERVRAEGWFGRRVPNLTVPWAVAEENVLVQAEMPTADRPITGYPETFVLDGRGRVRLRLVGPVDWDVPTWQSLMSMLPDLPIQAAMPAMPPNHPPLPMPATPAVPGPAVEPPPAAEAAPSAESSPPAAEAAPSAESSPPAAEAAPSAESSPPAAEPAPSVESSPPAAEAAPSAEPTPSTGAALPAAP